MRYRWNDNAGGRRQGLRAGWTGVMAAIAVTAVGLAPGCSDDEEEDEFPVRDATPADLAGREFGFPPDFFEPGDPREGEIPTVTFSDFDTDGDGDPMTAKVSIVTATSVAGGTLRIGSCIFESLFLAIDGEEPAVDDTVDTFDCEVTIEFGNLVLTSANGEEDFSSTPSPSRVLLQESVDVAPLREIPPVSGRAETGVVELALRSGNILEYTITVDNLDAGDVLTNAHIHTGSSVENGPVAISLVGAPVQLGRTETIAFVSTGGGASVQASIVLTNDEVDLLLDEAAPLYINIHSTNEPAGLLRGQIRDSAVEAFTETFDAVAASTTDFEGAGGAQLAGGEVLTVGILGFYSSGSQSYLVGGADDDVEGVATITLPKPATRIEVFVVGDDRVATNEVTVEAGGVTRMGPSGRPGAVVVIDAEADGTGAFSTVTVTSDAGWIDTFVWETRADSGG